MRINSVVGFGKTYVHAHKNGIYPEHRVCLRLTGDIIAKHGMNHDVSLFMSELEWVAFKNSVLAADAKMFGRRRDDHNDVA